MLTGKGNYIDGAWKRGTGAELSSVNPATGEIFWKGSTAVKEEVGIAIDAASRAFEGWSQTSLQERTAFLTHYEEILKDRKELLTDALSLETGKPKWEAATEAGAMIGKIAISIRAHSDRCKELTQEAAGSISITRHRPHGVVGVLGPYNFPGHLPNGHLVPALLAGNTAVLKPSELTPYVGEMLIDCWAEIGLPPGVLNMVQGGGDTGRAVAEHPGINGLFFTGSASTGLKLSHLFADNPEKILALELGGNNPLVFGSVDDTAAAVLTTIQSAYLTAGQRCTCARRLIVLRNTQGDAFLEQLASAIKKIRVGKPDDASPSFMGPVITAETAKKLLAVYQDLIERGAVPLVSMEHVDTNTGLLRPALVDVTGIADRADEEYFGPLLQVIRVDTLDDAIAEANNTRYGLSAGILTHDDKEYAQFLTHIRAGIVNRNTPLTGASSAAPFGGIGHSGNHRPSAYYAADYCSYPVASLEKTQLTMPETLPPGIEL